MIERGLQPLAEDDIETVLCVVAHPDDGEHGTTEYGFPLRRLAAADHVDVTGHVERAVESLEEHRLHEASLPEDFPSPREIPRGPSVGAGSGLATRRSPTPCSSRSLER